MKEKNNKSEFYQEELEELVAKRTLELKNAYSSLKQSEHRIRLVTDNLPVLISYIDINYCYQFVTKGYEEWFGLPTREIEGKHTKDVLGEESFQKIKNYFDQALSGEKVSYDALMPYKHGPSRYVHVA